MRKIKETLTRYQNAIVGILLVSSLVATVIVVIRSPALLDSAYSQLYWVGPALLVSELSFIIGALLMAISAGENISHYRRLRHIPHGIVELRRNARFFAQKILVSKLFAVGFWMNFAGAVATSGLLIAGLSTVAPLASAGIITVIIIDLIATFGWRVPLEVARRKAVRRGNTSSESA